jgi:hypothetical protein
MGRKAGDLDLFGAWLNSYYPDGQRIEFAAELEDLGFRTIWLGVGPEPVGDLRLYEAALRATHATSTSPRRRLRAHRNRPAGPPHGPARTSMRKTGCEQGEKRNEHQPRHHARSPSKTTRSSA